VRIKLACITDSKILYVSIPIGLFIVFFGTMGGLERKKDNMEKRLSMKEAIEARKQATRENPDDANAHFHLGYAYFNHGLYKEAIEAYKQAISINPDDADVHYNLGVAYVGLGMHKEAIKSFQQAIKINPDDAGARTALEQYEMLKNLKPEMANELFSPNNE